MSEIFHPLVPFEKIHDVVLARLKHVNERADVSGMTTRKPVIHGVRKVRMNRATSSARSRWIECPTPEIISSFEFLINSAKRLPSDRGTISSSVPHTKRVGICIFRASSWRSSRMALRYTLDNAPAAK